MPELSLVIPVYNEEENLPLLMEAICVSLQPLNREWEVIFVDDGSTDRSVDVLKRLVDANAEHARAVIFRRNFGQTAAIAAGIDHARGSIIILLDADLQNDPADIPLLLAKLDEGYDLVVEMDSDLSHLPEQLPRLLEAACEVAGGDDRAHALDRQAVLALGDPVDSQAEERPRSPHELAVFTAALPDDLLKLAQRHIGRFARQRASFELQEAMVGVAAQLAPALDERGVERGRAEQPMRPPALQIAIECLER